MYDLLRINNAYSIVPRGTATVGIFICTMSRELAEALGWGEEKGHDDLGSPVRTP